MAAVVALVCAPSALGYSFGWSACANPAGSSCSRATSTPEVVYDWDTERCQDQDSPDSPVKAFRFRNANGDWRVQMNFGNGFGSRRLIGPDILSARRESSPSQPAAERQVCGTGGVGGPPTGDIVLHSQNSPDPSSYDNVEWLTSPYLVSDGAGGGTVHALVHNEFHGELWRSPVDQCPTGLLNDCWYASVTLASSNGSERPGLVNALGAGYEHPAGGSKLVASIPYRYEPGPPPFGRQGFGAHSNVIKWGSYYYMLGFISGRYGAQLGPGTCVLRTDDLSQVDHWRAWGGYPVGFNVSLVDPYGPAFDPAQHACLPIARNTLTSVVRTVVWNRYLKKFMAIGSFGEDAVYSFSDDLINWSEQQPLASVETPSGACQEILHYPTVLDPADPAASGAGGAASEPPVTPNFDHPGRSSYLYFSRQNRTTPDCAQTTNRDLVRVPLRLQQRRTTLEEGLLGGDYGFDVRTATGDSHLNLVDGPDYDADGPDRYAEARTVLNTGSRFASGWLQANKLDDGDDFWYGSAYFLPSGFTAANTTVSLLGWESSAAGFSGGIRLLGSGTAADRYRLMRASSSGTTYLGPAAGFDLPMGRWFWLEVHQKLGKVSGSPTLNEVFVDGRLVMGSTEQNRDAADSGQVVRLKYGFVDNASPAGTDSTMLIDRSSITAAQLGAIGAPATPTGLRQVFAAPTVVGFHANSVPGASGYRFYRKQNGVWAQVGDNNSNPLWIDGGLTCGTRYFYAVTAYRRPTDQSPELDVSESIRSSQLSITTAACP